MSIVKIYVNSSANNTHIIVLNSKTQQTLLKFSCGMFSKGALRSNPSVVQKIVQAVVFNLLNTGYTSCILFIKGVGFGKSSSFLEFVKSNLSVQRVYFVNTRIFNGCRKKKVRRL